MASWKACCTDCGAPSPIWQQGAITVRVSLALVTPPLAAVTFAVPPPMAVRTALWPLDWIEITLPLVVLQDTGRSVRATPVEEDGIAVTERVWPRLKVSVLPEVPLNPTTATGNCTVGPPDDVYRSAPPSNVCRYMPADDTSWTSLVGRPRIPLGPDWLT